MRSCARMGALAAALLALWLLAPAASAARAPHRPGRAVSPVATGPSVQVVQTSASLSQALTPMPALRFRGRQPSGPTIRIRDGIHYQRFRGAGGAMTDTSAWLIARGLAPGTRAWLLRQLFGPGGISLNLIRVPIGASDFTATHVPYTYDDVPAHQSDPTLSHFSIAHDLAYVVPLLRQSLKLADRPYVLATPWSPPAWMKTNDLLSNIRDSGQLLPTAYAPLAWYFVRFLRAYARQGIHVQAITPQNEPGQQSTYPGLNENAAQEENFIHSYLAPALRQSHLHTAIYGYDGGWSGAPGFIPTLLGSPAASDLAGIATHCYYGSPTVMAFLHQVNPKLDQIETECSPGKLSFPVPELEIASLREWASGVALWNLALNPRGGPVDPPNYGCRTCTGIVTVNPVTHHVAFTSSFYDLGQLSKFVAPGAVRIASNNFVSYVYKYLGADIAAPGLDDVAFRNPGGGEALVTFNGAAAPIKFSVQQGRWSFPYTLRAGAMATFAWRPAGRRR